MMIDWHSHILPGMDDGSRNTAESLKLLEMLSQQHVDTVIATPHFSADNESFADFLARRKRSYERLCLQLPKDAPKILLSAEIKYYPGLRQHPDLHQMCIEGTNILLLEMPFGKWSEFLVGELLKFTRSSDFVIVLAHIERYLAFQDTKVLRRLYESGIMMQANASFFTRFATRRKALTLLRNGGIHLLGSDCHNATTRPPLIDQALQCIEKKFGADFVCQMQEYGRSVLLVR